MGTYISYLILPSLLSPLLRTYGIAQIYNLQYLRAVEQDGFTVRGFSKWQHNFYPAFRN